MAGHPARRPRRDSACGQDRPGGYRRPTAGLGSPGQAAAASRRLGAGGSPSPFKLAMSARLVGTRNPALQHEIWTEAIQATNGNLAAMLVLERLSTAWKWEKESEQTLWTIARAFPDQTWVHQELFNVYKARNDTSNMRELMNVLRTADPSVPRYQHDWALLSLLQDGTSEWTGPKEIMRKLYDGDPSNPNYATGYAFALARVGQGRRGPGRREQAIASWTARGLRRGRPIWPTSTASIGRKPMSLIWRKSPGRLPSTRKSGCISAWRMRQRIGRYRCRPSPSRRPSHEFGRRRLKSGVGGSGGIRPAAAGSPGAGLAAGP